MPFVEDYQEFAKRQACNSIKLENGTVLFENGAQWIKQSFDGNERYTTRMEPPTEKFALLRAKRLYIQANQDVRLPRIEGTNGVPRASKARR